MIVAASRPRDDTAADEGLREAEPLPPVRALMDAARRRHPGDPAGARRWLRSRGHQRLADAMAQAAREERQRIVEVLNLARSLSGPNAAYVRRRAFEEDRPDQADVLRELADRP